MASELHDDKVCAQTCFWCRGTSADSGIHTARGYRSAAS